MDYFRADLLMLKALLKESLRCKRNNVCELVLYTQETQELVNVLEYILNNETMLNNIYKDLYVINNERN